MKPSVHGIIVIDKPAGISSFGVVKAVRRILKVKKIGHLGTLDPFATGVLPLCLNEATKLVPFLIEEPKTYQATLWLGAETDTQDLGGKIIKECADLPAVDNIVPVIKSFAGEQWQVPPMYSALRYQGQRLYHLGRQGLSLEVNPRRITIYRLEIDDISPPEVTFTVTCSKGTYIRTLAADIGRQLGCGAYLRALRRLQVGAFSLSQALALPEPDDPQAPEKLWSYLIPLADALPNWPTVAISDQEAKRLRQGQNLQNWPGQAAYQGRPLGERVRVLQGRELVAVAELSGEPSRPALSPIRVFAAGQRS
ncbi:MAG: tRNA pseudouridine(55) synthase TruB [Desulfobacca sp. 4484_104]|nr:MAG: tRNA pseudouridine(55) synthase TruB [Desulfobacca sp. 4484_104]RLA89053.1 MAG: tRNA pseudouridine(55) synthase TruB [Deltaproteobacteria bacterium]